MSSSLLPTPPPLRSLLEPVVLRSVAPGAAPFPGDVVVYEGEPALAVSSADVAGTGIWAAGGEHVMAPLDMVATADGPLVLLPTVRCSLETLLRRRGSVEAGEGVTIAVSLLRGVAAEITTHPRGACVGSWWIDTAGTPLFVHGHDGPTAADGAFEMLAILETDDHDATARAIEAASVGVRDTERLVAALPALERALFAAARPRALRLDDAPSTTSITRAQARADAGRSEPAWRRLATAMDGSLSDLVAERIDALRQRWRRPPVESTRPRSRRLMLLVGAGVAALVLAAGLLWPESEETIAEPAASDAGLGQGEVAARSPSDDPLAEPAADAVSATRSLLAEWVACASDACRQELEEAHIDADPEGAATVADVALTVIDDLGGLTLLRADDPRGLAVSQIVAVVRRNDEWVLRGIHDVAQHP